MEFLYLLEKLRMPGLNEFMLAITTLGEETAFLVLALILFWCVDKRQGYFLLSVGFLGTIASQFLKLWFRIPRPWVLDGNFTILEAARESAAGYSFPSGHTTSAVGTFGAIAAASKKKNVIWLCVILAVLVGISRMYIGVHTPKDVIAGALISVLLILLLRPVIYRDRGMDLLTWVMPAAALALAGFVLWYPFPADTDAHNLTSGLKSACTMAGCTFGVFAVYRLEKKYLNFSTEAVWWAQILKVVLGFGLVLAVKDGLRAPLEALFGDPLPARAVRYFLIVLAAGVVWPMTFRFFSKLGSKTEERK